jgi:tRNA threonylcarbamoyladenosine biosynthesis protein TsaE
MRVPRWRKFTRGRLPLSARPLYYTERMSTVMTWQITSTASDDTERLGELLGTELSGGEVIELRSDLGGGKTTFVRGLARGAGSKDPVSSPTFTLNNIYKCLGGLEIHHYDFYRLDQPGIVAEQLAESRDNSKAVTVVEWSDIVKNVLPKDRFSIKLEPTKTIAEERVITITYPETRRDIIAKAGARWKEVRP